MRFLRSAVLFLIPSALAGVVNKMGNGPKNVQTGPQTTSKTNCATRLGKASARIVPTQSFTQRQTLPPVAYVTTVHSTTTVTPSPFTSTSTVYVTTVSTVTATTVTDSFSTTSTVYVTTTSTATVTATSTTSTDVTSTTTVSTTVSPGAGFEDAYDTLDGYPSSSKKRDEDLEESDPEPDDEGSSSDIAERGTSGSSGISCQNGGSPAKNGLYPTLVACTKTIQVFSTKVLTVTGTPYTVTATAKTVETTSTSTITSTTTVVPSDVSTTLSYSTTSTVTDTTTSITTTTTTSTETDMVTSTTTSYVICTDSANLLGPEFTDPDGRYVGISYANQPSGTSITYTTTDDAYDCCILCQDTTDCAASTWYDSYCYRWIATTCAAQSSNEITAYIFGSLSGYTISNGVCGYFVEEYDG